MELTEFEKELDAIVQDTWVKRTVRHDSERNLRVPSVEERGRFLRIPGDSSRGRFR